MPALVGAAKLQSQPFETDTGQVGIGGVEALQRRDRLRLKLQPYRAPTARTALGGVRLDNGEAFAHRLHLLFGQRVVARERRQFDVVRGGLKQGGERALWIGDGARLQLRQPFRRAPLARRRAQIEEFAAADGALRRGVAQHEAVACRRRDRPVEHELHRCLAAGRNRCVAQQHDTGADLSRGMMQTRRHPLGDRLLLGREQPQGGIDAIGRRVQIGIENHLTALNGSPW